MHASSGTTDRSKRRWLATAAAVAAGMVLLAACGSSTKKASTAATTSTTASSSSSSPGTMFSAANVPGLGMALVDGRGRTVYLLTSGDHTNATCDDPSGCTKIWPDLPLPDGVSAATAGMGLQASLLGTMKLSHGETYPTYGGWLMYEFSGDSGSGQGNGEGIQSFGGTWYALSPSGSPITSRTSSSPTTAAATSSGGY